MVLTRGQIFPDFETINDKAIRIAEKDGVKLNHRDSKTITEQEVTNEGYKKDLVYHYIKFTCEKSGVYKPRKGSQAAEGRIPLKNKRCVVLKY